MVETSYMIDDIAFQLWPREAESILTFLEKEGMLPPPKYLTCSRIDGTVIGKQLEMTWDAETDEEL